MQSLKRLDGYAAGFVYGPMRFTSRGSRGLPIAKAQCLDRNALSSHLFAQESVGCLYVGKRYIESGELAGFGSTCVGNVFANLYACDCRNTPVN